MQSLPHFINSLKALELNIFIINTNLEPLMINHCVSDDLETLINTLETKALVNSIILDIKTLNESLSKIAKFSSKATKAKTNSKTEPYASFIIDEPALVKQGYYKQLSFKDIINASSTKIKPIKRQKPFSYLGLCIHCGAANGYIYDHTKTQKRCKVCKMTFTIRPNYHEEITHHCPHCENKLSLKHNRAEYDVLACQSNSCPFYLKNKKLFKSDQAQHLKTISNAYKLSITLDCLTLISLT